MERSPILVRPNPTNGAVEVRLPDGTLPHDDAKVSVLDPAGRVLSEERLTGANSTLDLGTFGPGLYLISVETDGGRLLTTRVVVH